MALFLLTLGLSLVSAQELNPQAIVQKNYNMAKVSGIWYPVSMASDDIKRIEENGDLRVFIWNIESLEDGRLRFHFRTMVHGECEHVAMVCEKAERDGEHSISRRVPDLGPSFLDRFEKVCRKYGLGPQNIIRLGNQGEPPASCASSPGPGVFRRGFPAEWRGALWGEAHPVSVSRGRSSR
ncbi:epididymal-specific lipocalin-9 [Puma concolor]|uniref:Epididymal-specific lipocalin-9 n=1 Tax=Puma concolor TaxID=9696 RepID=A0A6P6HUN4_PUMCO|nr:epididymal-specific lipocalin-9 [Puma concolor]